jgi:hypothetical protein
MDGALPTHACCHAQAISLLVMHPQHLSLRSLQAAMGVNLNVPLLQFAAVCKLFAISHVAQPRPPVVACLPSHDAQPCMLAHNHVIDGGVVKTRGVSLYFV